MMKYGEPFVALVNEVFQDSRESLSEIRTAMSSGDTFKVRVMIEDKMDEYSQQPTGDLTPEMADRVLTNIVKYTAANRLYSMFMEQYTTELDKLDSNDKD